MTENIFIKDNVLIKYKRTDDNDNIVIPEGVTRIGSRAFDDFTLQNWYISNPVIPSSVRCIDEYAFTGVWLTILSIDIPGTVLEIGDYAFKGKSNVYDITLNEGLERIGSKVIYGQKKLKKLYLPSSLTHIAEDAFENCSKQLKFYVPTENCYAASYLKSHNLEVRLIKEKKVNCKNTADKPRAEGSPRSQFDSRLKSGYRIRFKKTGTFSPGICDSKYGGQPYWNPNLPFPCDPSGNDLSLIAQFNLSQLPADTLPDIFPKQGMLQFFISSDHSLWEQSYKVVYHDTIDYSYEPSNWVPELDDVFLLGEMAIELVYHHDTYRSDDYYSGSWLLCYKGATLNHHPIYENKDMQKQFDQMLFQLDSTVVKVNGTKRTVINIGDHGFISFFINTRDLANQNFSSVYFHEDCF